LTFWEKAAEYMKRQPGFISTRLHKAVSTEARFHFINVAEWESADHFQKAMESDAFKELTAPYMKVFPHYPGLYKLIRN
jgi:heme-degrading monooxygenase HmoA